VAVTEERVKLLWEVERFDVLAVVLLGFMSCGM
jgi:hypothetical protein